MKSSNKKIRVLSIYSLDSVAARDHFSGVLDYLSGRGDYSLL